MICMKVTILLPVYNEEQNVRNAYAQVKAELERLNLGYEIIIAEDGSSDRSYEIAKEIASKDKNVTLSHANERLGRGCSLTRAIKLAKGNKVIYMDVDLATDLKHLKTLINALDNNDIATGSRLMHNSKIKRGIKREISSRVFNFLVRLFLKSKIRDHQCGFKGFNKERVIPILDKVRDNHWFWDTELLVRAQRAGLTIAEIPVEWIEPSEETKVNVIKDSINMFRSIIRLWIEFTF